MSDFKIAKTKNTPAVNFCAADCCIEFSGRSYPEDAGVFYENILRKVNPSSLKKIHVVLDFEYVSSSSIASILDMLKDLKNALSVANVKVTFNHESGDEDMIAVGENYQKLTGIPVNLAVK
ncbi:MAG: DUF1987 domain-containing protein [Crocinitomicaceae bacterium]|jgi:SiaC family regulatory phosphoprotein|nr:DUF1987 domain-containing protein [Crocinitomicaceae bacterium]